MPGKSVTPPLSVIVEVVRCYPLETGEEGNFAVAGVFREKLEAEKLGREVP